MKEENTKKKKSIYYILLAVGVLLLAAAVVLTVWFTTNGNNNVVENPPIDTPDDPNDPNDPTDPIDPTDPTDPTDPEEPNEPTGPSEPTEPTYVRPIAVETCSVEYDAIYINETTDFIYRHKAVDFAAEAGTEVYAMADGTVTAISLSEELGNLITIDHGEGLTTTYRFVEPSETLAVGAAVEANTVIGTVAEAYGSEAADGTHLHLEIAVDGSPVDPNEYLDLTYDEK